MDKSTWRVFTIANLVIGVVWHMLRMPPLNLLLVLIFAILWYFSEPKGWLWVLLALVLFPCTGQAQVSQRKRIQTYDNFCTSRGPDCKGWIPYRHPGDVIDGPIYWVVAYDGSACEVPGELVDLLSRNLVLDCPWRPKHG